MMTWGVGDVAQLRQFIGSGESEERQRVEQQKLSALLGFCETAGCRRQVLLQYFGETLHEPCGNCDTCLEPVADLGRHHRRAKGAVGGPTHGRALRPELSDRPPARPRRRRACRGSATTGCRPSASARTSTGATWQSVFRQLVAGGLARGGPGRLRRDAAGRRCGQGAARRARRWSCATTRRPRADGAAPREPKAAPTGLASDADRDLFEALRAKRRELAKANGLAPFMVFPDRTLIELAARKPADVAALETIHGIGQAKRERWGEDFLRVIREARQDRHGAGTDARRTSDPPDDRQPAPRPIATAP